MLRLRSDAHTEGRTLPAGREKRVLAVAKAVASGVDVGRSLDRGMGWCACGGVDFGCQRGDPLREFGVGLEEFSDPSALLFDDLI